MVTLIVPESSRMWACGSMPGRVISAAGANAVREHRRPSRHTDRSWECADPALVTNQMPQGSGYSGPGYNSAARLRGLLIEGEVGGPGMVSL